MPYRRSRSRRRVLRRRRIRLLAFVATGGLTCALLVASLPLFAPGEASDEHGAREAGVAIATSAPQSAMSGAEMRYPYSVVPGGVHSPGALAVAVADPIVAAHYAPIDIAHMRVVSVAEPRRAYVSYRVADRVYWTKRTVMLHPGEQLLTDGVREIRARCGNRISETPQTPTAPDEPDISEFDRALASGSDTTPFQVTMREGTALGMPPDGLSAGGVTLPADGGSMDTDREREGGPGGASLLAQNIPLGGTMRSERFDPPDSPFLPSGEGPAPIAPVPEPGSVILVATGLAGCGLGAWRRHRNGR